MSVKYMVEGQKMCSSSKNAWQKQKIRGRNHKNAWQKRQNCVAEIKKYVVETIKLRGKTQKMCGKNQKNVWQKPTICVAERVAERAA